MASLLNELAIAGLPKTEAKRALKAMLSLFRHKIREGKEIDLGFMKVIPKPSPPTTIQCNVGGKTRTIHMGESVRWKVSVSKSWQKTVKPGWSKL